MLTQEQAILLATEAFTTAVKKAINCEFFLGIENDKHWTIANDMKFSIDYINTYGLDTCVANLIQTTYDKLLLPYPYIPQVPPPVDCDISISIQPNVSTSGNPCSDFSISIVQT